MAAGLTKLLCRRGDRDLAGSSPECDRPPPPATIRPERRMISARNTVESWRISPEWLPPDADAELLSRAAGLSIGISSSAGKGMSSLRNGLIASNTSPGDLKTLLDRLRHHSVDDGVQGVADTSGRIARNRSRLLGLMRDQLLRHGPVRERRMAREQEVERRAERVDVGANVHGVAVDAARAPRSPRCRGRSFVVLHGELVVVVLEEAGEAHVENLGDADAGRRGCCPA